MEALLPYLVLYFLGPPAILVLVFMLVSVFRPKLRPLAGAVVVFGALGHWLWPAGDTYYLGMPVGIVLGAIIGGIWLMRVSRPVVE